MRNAEAMNRLRTGGSSLALIGVMLLASACTSMLAVPTRSASENSDNYRVLHPVSVESTIATLNLPGASGDAMLSATEISRLDSFVRGYQAHGRGKLSVIIPGNDNGRDRAVDRGKQIVDHAMTRGLREDEVVLRIDTATGGNTRATIGVSYESFMVSTGECGDWSKESSYDPSNEIYSNFGCSTQRNAVLMIANPADLTSARIADPHDTERSDMVVQQYREGKTTLAERSAAESAAITQFGN